MKYLIFILFLIQSVNAQNQDSKSLREEILKKTKELDISNIDEFAKSLASVRMSLEKYIDDKKLECSGEFSSLQINEDGISENVKKELTNEEKEACFLELKGFEVRFTNELFAQKEKLMKTMHKKQISEMEAAKAQIISELEESYAKTIKSTKSRRKIR